MSPQEVDSKLNVKCMTGERKFKLSAANIILDEDETRLECEKFCTNVPKTRIQKDQIMENQVKSPG